MTALSRFVSRNPWLTLALLLFACCALFGPARVGGFIGTHGHTLVLGTWHFVCALFTGAF